MSWDLPLDLATSIFTDEPGKMLSLRTVSHAWRKLVDESLKALLCSILGNFIYKTEEMCWPRLMHWLLDESLKRGRVDFSRFTARRIFHFPEVVLLGLRNHPVGGHPLDSKGGHLLDSKGGHLTFLALSNRIRNCLTRTGVDTINDYPEIFWMIYHQTPERLADFIKIMPRLLEAIMTLHSDAEYAQIVDNPQIKQAIVERLQTFHWEEFITKSSNHVLMRVYARALPLLPTHNRILLALARSPQLLDLVETQFDRTAIVVDYKDPQLWEDLRRVKNLKRILCLECSQIEQAVLGIIANLKLDYSDHRDMALEAIDILSSSATEEAIEVTLTVYLTRKKKSLRALKPEEEERLIAWLSRKDITEQVTERLACRLEAPPPYDPELVNLCLELFLFNERSYQRLLLELVKAYGTVASLEGPSQINTLLATMWPMEEDFHLTDLTTLAIRRRLIFVLEALQTNGNLRAADEMFGVAMEIDEKIYDLLCQ